MQPAEQDVKMRLLQAAKKLFAKQGFDGTSVRQICEEAGANVALISYYFGGKDKIFQALIETIFTQPIADDFLSREHDPAEGLRAFIREMTLFRLREPELTRLFHQEIMLNSPRLDVLRGTKFPLWRKARDLLVEGRRQGKFHFRSLDLTFALITRILLDSHEAYFKPLMSEEEPSAEQMIEEMTDFIMNGLQYKPSS